jgi:hypothetical protein
VESKTTSGQYSNTESSSSERGYPHGSIAGREDCCDTAEGDEMSEITKALSVRAPWAWAIMNGKPVENRDWSTNFRGVVWLHQSKHWSRREIEEDLEDIQIMAEKDGLILPKIDLGLMLENCGCIIGSIEIADCVQTHPSAFFVGEYGFVLRNPVPLHTPVPLKGALSFFTVPDGLIGDAA